MSAPELDWKPLRLEVIEDERGYCLEIMRTIAVVAKIDHTSLRNALLEEMVGLVRRANNPRFIATKPETDRAGG